MLKYRILSALVMIPAAIAALFLLPPTAFALTIIGVCMLGAWEWAQFLGLTQQKHRVVFAFAFGIGLVFMLKSTEGTVNLFQSPVVQFSLLNSLGWWLVATGLVLTFPKTAYIWGKSLILKMLFCAFTLVPFFWGMLVIRYYGVGDGEMGAWWLLYVMVLVWTADTGAYAFGRLFGKHKLVPNVSPGKTWEGLCGGLLTSALVSGAFCYYTDFDISMVVLFISSMIAVVASVFGDLTESMFKREAGIKDSSQLIPGHGGVLDRIDSLTAAIPVFAALILFNLS